MLVADSGTTATGDSTDFPAVGGAAGDSTDFPAAASEATVDGVVRSTPFPPASVSVDTEGTASPKVWGTPESLLEGLSVSRPLPSTPKAPPLLLEPVTGEAVACGACGGGGSALCFASVVSSCTYQMTTEHVRLTLLNA